MKVVLMLRIILDQAEKLNDISKILYKNLTLKIYQMISLGFVQLDCCQ
jgi:hypothetical protein